MQRSEAEGDGVRKKTQQRELAVVLRGVHNQRRGAQGPHKRLHALQGVRVGLRDRSECPRRAVKQIGAIDHPAESIAACADADLIVIATPPLAMPEVFQALAPRLRPETVLTDVASVKSPVLRWAEAHLPYPSRFVGGHPIAGTEHYGVRAARADLFHGAPWALTPTAQTDPDALLRVEAFVRTLRAAPLTVDPAQHDREFALLSFLPHAVAFSLAALHRENPTTDRKSVV